MFINEPPNDFAIADNRASFQKALDRLDDEIKQQKYYACPIIDGNEIKVAQEIKSVDPSHPDTTIGTVYLAQADQATKALTALEDGCSTWRATTPKKRAQIICNVAALMRQRRLALASLIVREAGKPWGEADADVIEAIDFCEYYAEQSLQLGVATKTADIPGEDNHYLYRPRGKALVIAPWNFPLAILCGMSVAALVTGNTAILKPSQQTSIIAFQFAKILLEAGIPPNALAFLPGYGSKIGAQLVEHPDIDLICFTGSLPVGLNILQKAAVVHPEQRGIKKVITELGGKNAIIIDEDADLDAAIKGVLYSAFGYAGQKCSACSRVIVVGNIYEPFVERLCSAASDLIVGEAQDSSVFFGPLIDKTSQTKVLKSIAVAEQECTLAFRGQAPSSGYFVPPVIFRDVEPEAALWREELFAPVLACCKAKSFTKAIELANDSQYALTGGLFSRSPGNIDLARNSLEVGNLYINRGCTGAIVGRQPFGGFRMSGIGSKAGGPDYLLQFMEPRTITENTMRKGFAPDLA
ncbi:L-glutamate gamma-semialdehyde dehydrogenase [Oligoflexia bacterium]|nr:L-glutamate gamma-semialdehyde dehydrogenase [Oligoflexia bacterium]